MSEPYGNQASVVALSGDGCRLECVKKIRPKYEFIGPVKIILIDPPKAEYCKKMWGAAFVALAIFLMGMTTMTVAFCTLGFILEHRMNLHIFLCTMGILIPLGILNLNPLNGPAMVMKVTDQRIEHSILQISGVIFALVGSVVVLVHIDKKYYVTPHCIAGLLTWFFVFLAVIFGPVTLFMDNENLRVKYFKITHMAVGMLAFVCSSVCFILGLLKPSLELWYGPAPSIVYFTVGFCIFYTFIVVLAPILKWVKWAKED